MNSVQSFFKKSYLLCLLALLLFPHILFAEFLKTGHNVHQSTNRKVRILTSKDKVFSGFFLSTGTPMDLQVFHPSKIPSKGTLHCFIRYNYGLGTYDRLYVQDKVYQIKGSFTLNLGFLRVTVDPAQPYLSVVYDNALGSKQAPDILGFRGLEPIVNSVGNIAVALLEANQFSKYRSVIAPYFVKEIDGNLKLLVNGQEVAIDSIGLALESPKVCSKKGMTLLSKEDVDTIKSIGNPRKREVELNKILKNARRTGRFSELVYLRSDENAEIAYDSADGGKIYILKPTKGQTCVVEQVRLG